MIRYEHTEVGRGLRAMAVGVPVMSLVAVTPMMLEVISGRTHPGILIVLVLPVLTAAIILPGISKLSVRLIDETLEVRMGVFSRKIKLSDLKTLSIIEVPWWAGWGLRYSLTGGQLWRVSGNRAVRFGLRNGGSFSVGLLHATELERAIRSGLPNS